MPVYEYRCSRGHQYEKPEGFDAPTQQRCEKCSATARRVISMPAVIFKGSGFYSTDNRKSSSGGGSNGKSEPALDATDGGDTAASKVEASVD